MLLSLHGFMLLSFLSSFTLLSFIGHVNAEPKVVSMQTKRMPRANNLQKRDGGATPNLYPGALNLGNFDHLVYYAAATVGTPGQEIWFSIGTVFSDTWVLGSEITGNVFAEEMHTFDSSKSDTYKASASQNVTIDGVGEISGKWFTDEFALEHLTGHLTLTNLTMALATKDENIATTMGLGLFTLLTNASDTDTSDSFAPLGILDQMAAATLIKSRSFSLWMDRKESDSGSILFGGIDTAKFDGTLYLIDIQQPQSEFVIPLIDITLKDANGSESLGFKDPVSAWLNLDVPFITLPEDMFDDVARYFGAVEVASLGAAKGARVTVPFSELALPFGQVDGDKAVFNDGTAMCLFGFQPGTDEINGVILGQSFLRSAYVLFDLDAMKIGIADANWDVAKESKIVEVVKGSPVESASEVSAVTVTDTFPIAADNQAFPTGFGSVTDAGLPGSAAKTLESGVKTTLSGAETHTGKSGPSPTSNSASSSSAAAAPVALEQSTLPLLSLTLCGAIMLIAAMAF